MSIYPEHGKPYYNLACLKALQGDKVSAIKYLTESLSKNPDFIYDAKNDPDLKSLKATLIHRIDIQLSRRYAIKLRRDRTEFY
jgi:Tfp pilus assembly protein PilF